MSHWNSPNLSLSLRGPDGETTIELEQPYAIVGSDPKCHVVAESSKVASRALLFLSTRNGVRAIVLSLNAKQPGRLMKVEPDRPLKLHSFEITAATSAPESPNESRHSDLVSSQASPDTIFAVTWKTDKTRRFVQLADSVPTLVGRKSPATILLDNDRSSGLHCCLVRVGESLWVIDLLSRNGTVVSGVPASCSQLELGKSFVIGSQRLHFVRLHTDQIVSELEESNLEVRSAAERISGELIHDYLTLRSKAELNQTAATDDTAEREKQISELAEELTTIQQEREALRERNEALQQELEQAIAASTANEARLMEQIEEHERLAADAQASAVASDEEANAALQDREDELKRLTEELKTERRILDQLKIDIQPAISRPPLQPVEDDSCISSFDFQEVLEEALESLPTIDDES